MQTRLQPIFDVSKFFACWYCLHEYVFDFSSTTGASMEPLLHRDGHVIVYDRFMHRIFGIQKNNVVVCRKPGAPSEIVCKRIKLLENEFRGELQIPKGHCWLEGDNSQASYDSRNYGPVPVELIEGTLRAKIWPLMDFNWL